jgi:DNA-binding MarR family transcriptional regulator
MARSPYSENAAFTLLIRDVSRLLRKRFQDKVGMSGFTQAQWSVIYALSQNEGIHQAALAKLLDIEPITLVALLDKLEKAEIVERRPHPTDRRVRQLFLTLEAQPLLAKIETVRAELREEAFFDIPEPQQEHMMAILRVIKNNLLQGTRDNIH